MKATNVTPATRQVSDQRYTVTLNLSEKDASAIIRGRRDVRKATLKNDLGTDHDDLHDIDVINGLIMLVGSVLEDEGRDEREVDFDGRP